MKRDHDWVPDETDHDYIEALAEPLHPVLAAIEEDAFAARPRVPILDRPAGRVLAALAAGRRRIVEVGTAIGFSTLWMALAMPPEGRIVTIDPDASRTARARAHWRAAGVPDESVEVVNRPALDAFAAGDPALDGPFDLAFVDALKDEYGAYVEALVPRFAPGALLVVDNVLWSGRVSGARPAEGDEATEHLRAFNAALLRDGRFEATILPLGDGLLVATFVGGAGRPRVGSAGGAR
jgi:predicted O-methyltransferase YrrM